MVRTGAHVYVKYGWEGATLGALASGEAADKKFGLQDRVSSLSLTHNRINLPALNKNTIDKFAYGQQAGTASVAFTLANPWILGAILGEPVKAGSSSPYTYTYGAAASLKVPRTIQIEVGFDGASADIIRTLKGGLVNNLTISSSVNGIVDCTADIAYGKEGAPTTSLGSAPSVPSQEFPYTFAHAELTIGGAVVVQCQEASLSIAQNSELLYGLGDHQAVNSFRKVLDMTGSFRASWINKSLFEKVLEQIKQGSSSGTYSETVGGSPEFKLTFINTANEKIEITGTGLSFTDHAVSGLEPVEPVFEELNWQFKEISVVATSTLAAEA